MLSTSCTVWLQLETEVTTWDPRVATDGFLKPPPQCVVAAASDDTMVDTSR